MVERHRSDQLGRCIRMLRHRQSPPSSASGATTCRADADASLEMLRNDTWAAGAELRLLTVPRKS